jgi:hypothetical protein
MTESEYIYYLHARILIDPRDVHSLLDDSNTCDSYLSVVTADSPSIPTYVLHESIQVHLGGHVLWESIVSH